MEDELVVCAKDVARQCIWPSETRLSGTAGKQSVRNEKRLERYIRQIKAFGF